MAINSVLILKELEGGFNTGKALSGISRLENDSGVTELNLSLINLTPVINGELYLYIFGKSGEVYTFLLPPRPTSWKKSLEELGGVNDGYASALVFIKDDIPLTLAFGKTDGFNLCLSDAKKLVAEKCLLERRAIKRKPAPTLTVKEQQSIKERLYNDEAVATENYFELEEQIKEKLDKISQNEELSNANGNPTDSCQKEKEESKTGTDFLSDEKDLFASQGKGGKESQNTPFYITAQRELETIFDNFPAYDNLKCYFPDSKWVQIPYDNNRFYVVGLIKEDKKEKYICYGVPEKYSLEPPKDLKGYCTFIPLSIFDMQGDGFWMMFQDAVTGECVTKPN